MNLNDVNIPIQFDLRTATRITSSVLGLAGTILIVVLGASNPVGWVLTIAGAVGGFLALAFSSKEKRRQTAIDKVYTSVSNEIKKESPGQIEKMVNDIKKDLYSTLKPRALYCRPLFLEHLV